MEKVKNICHFVALFHTVLEYVNSDSVNKGNIKHWFPKWVPWRQAVGDDLSYHC